MDTKLASTTPHLTTTPLGVATAPLGRSTTPFSTSTPQVATGTGTGTLTGFGTTTGDQTLAARLFGTSDGRSARSTGDIRSSARVLGDHRSSRVQSDDTELSKRILETHESDDRGLPVKPVLHIIDVIFHRAIADLPGYNVGYKLSTP